MIRNTNNCCYRHYIFWQTGVGSTIYSRYCVRATNPGKVPALSLIVLRVMSLFSSLMHMILVYTLLQRSKSKCCTRWARHHEFATKLLHEIFEAHSLNLLRGHSLDEL